MYASHHSAEKKTFNGSSIFFKHFGYVYETIEQLFKFLLRWFRNFKCKIILFSLCRMLVTDKTAVFYLYVGIDTTMAQIVFKPNWS